MSLFQEKLKQVPVHNRESLAALMEEFKGSLHIESWTPEAWGDFASLAIDAGITAEQIADELCLESDVVMGWRSGAVLPSELVRNGAIRLVATELSRLRAA